MRIQSLLLTLPLLAACGEDPTQFRADEAYPPQAAPDLPVRTYETPQGVTVEVFKEGTQALIQQGSRVKVLYTGWVRNTTGVFDSNSPVGPPYPVTIGAHGVIPGWEFGLEGLTVGTKARFHIPAEHGYGEQAMPPLIPANSDLVFDVQIGQ